MSSNIAFEPSREPQLRCAAGALRRVCACGALLPPFAAAQRER